MAVDFATAAQARQERPSPDRPAVDRQCDFVSAADRLPVAAAAARFSEVEDGCTVFWRWRKSEVWKKVHDAVRGKIRKAAGKKSTPSAAIIDSQSVRTAEGGDHRGYDASRKITGRKRSIAVDTLGLICATVVHAPH